LDLAVSECARFPNPWVPIQWRSLFAVELDSHNSHFVRADRSVGFHACTPLLRSVPARLCHTWGRSFFFVLRMSVYSLNRTGYLRWIVFKNDFFCKNQNQVK
jgi:hypothetical protein